MRPCSGRSEYIARTIAYASATMMKVPKKKQATTSGRRCRRNTSKLLSSAMSSLRDGSLQLTPDSKEAVFF